MTVHDIPLERRTLHGHFSRDLPPVLGGNIDCNLLRSGATLFLPIPVDGAPFSAGDGHARQGDGELSQFAIECPLERAELTLDVRGGATRSRSRLPPSTCT